MPLPSHLEEQTSCLSSSARTPVTRLLFVLPFTLKTHLFTLDPEVQPVELRVPGEQSSSSKTPEELAPDGPRPEILLELVDAALELDLHDLEALVGAALEPRLGSVGDSGEVGVYFL